MNATTKSKIFVIGLVTFAVLVGYTGFMAVRNIEGVHKQEITRVIGEHGGVVKLIEVVEADTSPFKEAGKGNNVYKITYTKNGGTKTAWYCAINHSSIKQEPEAWQIDE
ncbi:hypothetical protein EDM56_20165 [Brevibacillus fluminis]|uniref:DUF3139 domain-containing protein n=1 Tax=Brevibacillus fluminis TaxID=511487 RepID=A0A3M8D8U0_9BACL|nr:hypothetical protein [Brevibacillus fluminis]RNB84436.1 hypothetical protein EDM56_20165 [Brevibacillus fluminis]